MIGLRWFWLGALPLALACTASDDPAEGAAAAGGESAHRGVGGAGTSGHAGHGGRGGSSMCPPLMCTGLVCDAADGVPAVGEPCSIPDNRCQNSVYVAGHCGNGYRCTTYEFYCCEGAWDDRPCAAGGAGAGGASGGEAGGESGGASGGVGAGGAGGADNGGVAGAP